MNIAVHLARHARLLVLCGLSLLLHLLALAWFAPRLELADRVPAGTPLALRLATAPAPAPAPVAIVGPDARTEEAAAAPPPPAAPAPTPERALAASPSIALPPMTPLLPAPSAPGPQAEPERAVPASGLPAAAGAIPRQMPGRYLVRMPPSARLTYALSRAQPGRAPANEGEAQLVWETGAGRYQLRVEGVLGLLESDGGSDDAGIAPVQASAHQDDGSDRITRFDRAAGRIAFASAPSENLHLGSQDQASVLMQLAGMGLAQPEQMQDVIEILVGGPDGAEVARFRVLGREQLDSPAGQLATVRLAQLAEPGRRRLEVWLAPRHNWMPVQLRVTEADGTVANQVVTRIETAPPEAAQAM